MFRKKYAKFCPDCGTKTGVGYVIEGYDPKTGVRLTQVATQCPFARDREFDPHYFETGTAANPDWDLSLIFRIVIVVVTVVLFGLALTR